MAASLPFQGCDKPALNTDDAPEQWIGGKRPCRAVQLKEQQWRQRRTKGLPAAPLGVLSECLEDCEEWAASESGEEFALACWACSACTLLNAAARARCGACGGAAPAREGRPDRAAAPHGGAALERGGDPAAWPSLGESVDTAWARCEVSSVGASSWLEVEDEQELAGWLDADGAALDDGEGSCASFLVVAGAPAAEDPAPAAAEVPPSWAARAAAGARAGARVPAPSVRVPPLRRPAPRLGAAPAGGAGQGGECQPDALDQLEERRMRPAGLRGRRGRCR